MNRWWLAGGITIGVLCGAGLAAAIKQLIRVQRSSLIVAVPLAAEQDVELSRTGRMLLHVEGPQLTRTFSGLDYELIRRDDGARVPLHATLFRIQSSTVRRARVAVRTFTIDADGRYTLRVRGLERDAHLADRRLVITRDARTAVVGAILAIVLTSIGLVGGLVVSGIAAMSRGAR